jgi:hypothetical protein
MDIKKLLEKIPDWEKLLSERLPAIPYDGLIDEHIYDTLNCNLDPEVRLPWVEEILVPGHPYHETYCMARDACKRVLRRLGTAQEDLDMEEIFDCLQDHELIMAKKMFEYGRIYEREYSQK